MDFSNSMPQLDVTPDATLVAASLGGDYEAYAQIVSRYQRLLCSLAYSATGQLSQSEDLAQETFIEAWRKLDRLREPEKLRSWLCGILRFKISHLRRAEGTEPVRRADSLEEAAELSSADRPIADQAVQKEEQALLWSALERVPETFREPLILYYREHQSVEHVAAALDLSEDAVKQRLSRGRKILQEQVLAFVEGALSRTTPGKLFTLAVIAALPPLSPHAKAAGVATAAAKGAAMAKSMSVAGIIAALSGVINAALTLRANLDQARTPRERRFMVKVTLSAFLGAWTFLGVIYAGMAAARHWPAQGITFAALSQITVIAVAIAAPWLLLWAMRSQRRLRTRERREHPEFFQHSIDQIGSTAGAYKSDAKLFGIPLVHVRFATPDEGEPPVVGWFAGGDRAIGLIAAWGGLAVAPFSVGAVSCGIIALGSISFGLLSIGTVALGGLCIGCAVIGIRAYAWLSALGWQTAQGGGFSIARAGAEGPLAFAPHANDATARALLANPNQPEYQALFYILVALFTLVPVIIYAAAVRKRLGRDARSRSTT